MRNRNAVSQFEGVMLSQQQEKSNQKSAAPSHFLILRRPPVFYAPARNAHPCACRA